MDNLFSHCCNQKTLSEFLRTERFTLLVAVMIFLCFYLVVIFSLDIEYFYPRMFDDSLLYFLKAAHLVKTGNGAASFAENLPPFRYMALPGYLRAPLLLLSEQFNIRLRLIQLANIGVLVLVAVLFSYYLSLVLPSKYSKIIIIVPFFYLATVNYWQFNVLLPLSDGFFALTTFTVIVLTISVKNFHAHNRSTTTKLVLIILLTLIAIAIKVTGLFLILYIFICWRPMLRQLNKKFILISMIIGLILVCLIFYLNLNTVIFYTKLWYYKARFEIGPVNALLNLSCLALPSQIIPNFSFAYLGSPFPQNTFSLWETNGWNMFLMGIGLAITFVTILGVWNARNSFFPEAVYFLCAIPVITPITSSTIRYLGAYQPFIWIFFGYGTIYIYKTYIMPQIRYFPSPRVIVSAVSIITLLLLFIRLERAMGKYGANLKGSTEVNRQVAAVYRDLRNYLASLPIEKSRLVFTGRSNEIGNGAGDAGKWQAILGLNYYTPDQNFSKVVRQFETYVVFDWDIKFIGMGEQTKSQTLAKLTNYYNFRVQKMFSRQNQFAQASVYRIFPSD